VSRGGTPTSIGWPRDDICWAPGPLGGIQRANSVLYGVRIRTPALTSAKNGPGGVRATGYGRPGHCGEHPASRQSRADGIQNGFSSGVIRLGKKPLAAVRQELATNRSRTPGSGGTTTPPTRSVPRMPAHIRVSSGRLGRRRSATPQEPADGICVPECDVSGVRWRAPRRIGGGRDAFVYPCAYACAYPWAVTGASMSGVASGAEVADAAALLGAVPMM
jgi:hypothetical protein